MFGIASIVVCAAVFWRIAVVEQLKPAAWAAASVAVSVVSLVFAGQFTLLFGQIAWFGVLWWYNMRHKAQRTAEWQGHREAERQAEERRRRWAEEQIKRDREQRQSRG